MPRRENVMMKMYLMILWQGEMMLKRSFGVPRLDATIWRWAKWWPRRGWITARAFALMAGWGRRIYMEGYGIRWMGGEQVFWARGKKVNWYLTLEGNKVVLRTSAAAKNVVAAVVFLAMAGKMEN